MDLAADDLQASESDMAPTSKSKSAAKKSNAQERKNKKNKTKEVDTEVLPEMPTPVACASPAPAKVTVEEQPLVVLPEPVQEEPIEVNEPQEASEEATPEEPQ